MAERWDCVVDTFMKNETENVLVVAKAVTQKQCSLNDVVAKLGEHLKDTDADRRSRAVNLLAHTLQQLPRNFCHAAQTGFLVDFFASRIADHYSVSSSALIGASSLAQFTSISGEDVRKLVTSIFHEDITVQAMKQADRHTVFFILQHFLDNRIFDLLPLSGDFVFGFIQTMDGEKDPSNLMMAFHSAKVITTTFSLNNFSEELFEVTSCYFPVDFTPPPDDPYEVTREDLSLALRRLLSSPVFSEFMLPLLLEKVDSSLVTAKMDSLHTLTACAEAYSYNDLKLYLEQLWSQLRREVCHVTARRNFFGKTLDKEGNGLVTAIQSNVRHI